MDIYHSKRNLDKRRYHVCLGVPSYYFLTLAGSDTMYFSYPNVMLDNRMETDNTKPRSKSHEHQCRPSKWQ